MKIHFGYILGISALLLAVCAAFFSVYGLSHMFAGATLSVIIMASTLELSKLVIATYLHNYWTRMNKLIRLYLTSGVIILALITSLGIYGYLSNAYQDTANKLELLDGNLGIHTNEIEQYNIKIDDLNKQKDAKSKRYDNLLIQNQNQENRLDERNTWSNRQAYQNTKNELVNIDLDIKELDKEIFSYRDSISGLNSKILETKTNSEISGEIGALKYMSEITGMDMGRIVNIFILLIVFVFDPLAICLVVATSSVFNIKRNEVKEEQIMETIELMEMEDGSEIIVDNVDTNEDIEVESIDVIDNKETNEGDEISKEEFLVYDEQPIEEIKGKVETNKDVEKLTYEQIKEVKNRLKETDEYSDRGFSKPIPNSKLVPNNKYNVGRK